MSQPPPIGEESWLNDDRHTTFRRAYIHAARHLSPAHRVLAEIGPEAAYWVWAAISRGMAQQQTCLCSFLEGDEMTTEPGRNPQCPLHHPEEAFGER